MTKHTSPARPLRGPLDNIARLCATAPPTFAIDPVRAALEAHVERCIALLDAMDGNPDLEDGADAEEGPDAEPNLGSLDRAIDQTRWMGPDVLNADLDREAEPYVRHGRRLPIRGWELLRHERAEHARVVEQLTLVLGKRQDQRGTMPRSAVRP